MVAAAARAGWLLSHGLVLAFLIGCATDRPLVKGFLDEEGVIYRDREVEEWGSRSRVVVRPFEF